MKKTVCLVLVLAVVLGCGAALDSPDEYEDVPTPHEQESEDYVEQESPAETSRTAGCRIEPAPGSTLVKGIVLENASVYKSRLDEVAFDVQDGSRRNKGLGCLVVMGHVRNITVETQEVYIWADGYNSKGERKAATLVSDTQPGFAHLTIPEDTSQEFEIALSLPNRLSVLRFSATDDEATTPRLYAEGEVLAVAVEPQSGTFLAEGIRLDGASARAGILRVPAYVPRTWDYNSQGDWCVLVSGQIGNTSMNVRDVDLWVDGFNADGEQVASTLATEAQEGFLHLDVPGETTLDFEIGVSWSDEIQTLRIAADIDDRMIPSPPAMPASRIPEGLTVFPAVGEYLTTSPRGEESELLLLAVEVELVGSPEEFRYRTGDEKRTIQPGEPVLVVRGVIQNRHRAYSEIGMSAHGYNGNGEQVSRTLDAAHIPGAINADTEPGTVGEFVLHMNPAEDLKAIYVYGATYPIPPP